MEKQVPLSRVLLYQSAGFVAIIALSWLNEWLGLPSLIFKDHPYVSDLRVSAIEMLLTLGVWLIVAGSTRRLLGRIGYLESFMRMCAWCRRIRFKDRWIPLEQFFAQGFDTPTSHGICPTCLEEQAAAAERARQDAAARRALENKAEGGQKV
jgi:hypothetical protein